MILLSSTLQQLQGFAWLVFYLGLFLLWLFVALWVRDDADRRGQNGVIVGLLVGLVPLPGIILWLVLRPARVSRAENREAPARPPPPVRRPPRSPEHSTLWRIAKGDSRESDAIVIDEAPSAGDAELKARDYLRESPDAFVYVLNPDGSRYRVIL